uniref:Uncharacterized protein n=1 Tax=Mucochytrium quahogii TaxID=96639 RepID=A0A7S2RYB3_9STRA
MVLYKSHGFERVLHYRYEYEHLDDYEPLSEYAQRSIGSPDSLIDGELNTHYIVRRTKTELPKFKMSFQSSEDIEMVHFMRGPEVQVPLHEFPQSHWENMDPYIKRSTETLGHCELKMTIRQGDRVLETRTMRKDQSSISVVLNNPIDTSGYHNGTSSTQDRDGAFWEDIYNTICSELHPDAREYTGKTFPVNRPFIKIMVEWCRDLVIEPQLAEAVSRTIGDVTRDMLEHDMFLDEIFGAGSGFTLIPSPNPASLIDTLVAILHPVTEWGFDFEDLQRYYKVGYGEEKMIVPTVVFNGVDETEDPIVKLFIRWCRQTRKFNDYEILLEYIRLLAPDTLSKFISDNIQLFHTVMDSFFSDAWQGLVDTNADTWITTARFTLGNIGIETLVGELTYFAQSQLVPVLLHDYTNESMIVEGSTCVDQYANDVQLMHEMNEFLFDTQRASELAGVACGDSTQYDLRESALLIGLMKLMREDLGFSTEASTLRRNDASATRTLKTMFTDQYGSYYDLKLWRRMHDDDAIQPQLKDMLGLPPSAVKISELLARGNAGDYLKALYYTWSIANIDIGIIRRYENHTDAELYIQLFGFINIWNSDYWYIPELLQVLRVQDRRLYPQYAVRPEYNNSKAFINLLIRNLEIPAELGLPANSIHPVAYVVDYVYNFKISWDHKIDDLKFTRDNLLRYTRSHDSTDDSPREGIDYFASDYFGNSVDIHRIHKNADLANSAAVTRGFEYSYMDHRNIDPKLNLKYNNRLNFAFQTNRPECNDTLKPGVLERLDMGLHRDEETFRLKIFDVTYGRIVQLAILTDNYRQARETLRRSGASQEDLRKWVDNILLHMNNYGLSMAYGRGEEYNHQAFFSILLLPLDLLTGGTKSAAKNAAKAVSYAMKAWKVLKAVGKGFAGLMKKLVVKMAWAVYSIGTSPVTTIKRVLFAGRAKFDELFKLLKEKAMSIVRGGKAAIIASPPQVQNAALASQSKYGGRKMSNLKQAVGQDCLANAGQANKGKLTSMQANMQSVGTNGLNRRRNAVIRKLQELKVPVTYSDMLKDLQSLGKKLKKKAKETFTANEMRKTIQKSKNFEAETASQSTDYTKTPDGKWIEPMDETASGLFEYGKGRADRMVSLARWTQPFLNNEMGHSRASDILPYETQAPLDNGQFRLFNDGDMIFTPAMLVHEMAAWVNAFPEPVIPPAILSKLKLSSVSSRGVVNREKDDAEKNDTAYDMTLYDEDYFEHMGPVAFDLDVLEELVGRQSQLGYYDTHHTNELDIIATAVKNESYADTFWDTSEDEKKYIQYDSPKFFGIFYGGTGGGDCVNTWREDRDGNLKIMAP